MRTSTQSWAHINPVGEYDFLEGKEFKVFNFDALMQLNLIVENWIFKRIVNKKSFGEVVVNFVLFLNLPPDSFTLGAYVDHQLVGVVSFGRKGATREKLRQKGLLFRVYVNNAFAGKGIGKQLITELLSRVRALKDIEQISLTVIADNENAIKLYTSFGFKTFSIEERAIKWKGNYLTE